MVVKGKERKGKGGGRGAWEIPTLKCLWDSQEGILEGYSWKLNRKMRKSGVNESREKTEKFRTGLEIDQRFISSSMSGYMIWSSRANKMWN